MVDSAPPDVVRSAAPASGRRSDAMHWIAAIFFTLALVCAGAAVLLGDRFYFRLATEALIFGGLALSVDLLLGCTGLLPLGHALFFGFGAYLSGLVLKNWAASFWLAGAVVLAGSIVLGLVAGAIAIRAKGVYFALITFGLAQVVGKVVFNTRELGASDGIIGIPIVRIPFGLFTINTSHAPSFFLLVPVLVMTAYAGLVYLMQTPFGRQLGAIRANESRVSFLGVDPWRYKLAAFVISTVVAALAGALYPMLRGFVSPELLFFQVSGNAVINVIVGGTGTLIGPLYGSVILTILKSVVGSFTSHHLIVIGLIFMVAVIFMPRGLVGYAAPILQRWLDRRPAR